MEKRTLAKSLTYDDDDFFTVRVNIYQKWQETKSKSWIWDKTKWKRRWKTREDFYKCLTVDEVAEWFEKAFNLLPSNNL